MPDVPSKYLTSYSELNCLCFKDPAAIYDIFTKSIDQLNCYIIQRVYCAKCSISHVKLIIILHVKFYRELERFTREN